MKQRLLNLSRRIDWSTAWVGKLTAFGVMAMILIGAWNVIGRYVGRGLGLNLSSNTLIELQWQLFAAVFLLGAAVTLQRDEHVRMDVFFKDFSLKQQAIANLFGILAFLLPFCLTLLWVSWRSVWNACLIWEQSPNPGGLPLCPAKFLVIFGTLLLIAQAVSELIKAWHTLTDPSNLRPKQQEHSIEPQGTQPTQQSQGEHPHG